MRKLFVPFITVLFCAFSGNAQLEKGSILLGGSGSISGGFGGNGGQYNLSLQPSIGIFVLPKFAIGSGIGFSSNYATYGDSYYSNQGVYLSPFARYYFLRSERKLNLFGQGGIALGGFWSKNQDYTVSRFSVVPNIKAGLAYFIRPQVALEASIYAGFETNTPIFVPGNQIFGSLGFQIHLDKRTKESEIKL